LDSNKSFIIVVLVLPRTFNTKVTADVLSYWTGSPVLKSESYRIISHFLCPFRSSGVQTRARQVFVMRPEATFAKLHKLHQFNGYVHPWLWFLRVGTVNQLIINVLALLPKKILYAPVSNNTHLPMSIWYYYQTNTNSFTILIVLLPYMCVSTQQIGITSCYGLHSAIQAIEFIDYLFYDLLQPLQWLKTRRPAVKTNPLASKTEMVCWGQHNVTTQKSFRKLHLAAQNQRCSSHKYVGHNAI
jgi:hypothetical protein